MCCSSPHMNCLPFLAKSYIGFNNFCNSGQNILRKLTIPAKFLQPVSVVGSCKFCIVSNPLLIGLRPTLLSCIFIQGRDGVSALHYLSCLGVWHHIYYYLYWVHCNTQCFSAGSLVFMHLGGMKE